MHTVIVRCLLCNLQGYRDLHAYNVAEAIYVVLYMFVSIGVAAYFVGTSVLLVVKNEERTGAYRYSQQRGIAILFNSV